MIGNLDQLVMELTQTIDELKNGHKTIEEANTIANIAGKVIAAQRVKIEYARSQKRIPKIKFLEDTVLI